MRGAVQVRWTASAAKDLQEIARYIREENPSAARSVAKALFDAANSLESFPLRGREGRIQGTRELVVQRSPHIIVYQVKEAVIQILHIYHGARNWPRER